MSKAQTFSLGEVCSFYNGKAHENVISESGNIKVINSKFVSSEGASYKLTNEVIFPLYKGDICLVMSDVPNGKTLAKCFLVDRDNSYSLNQRICVIRTNNFDLKFLFYQLNRNPYLLAFNNGENQTNLRKENILNCPLWMPSIPEQKRIVAILDQAFADIDQARATAEANLKNARELFDSYLQQVFSQRGDGWVTCELFKHVKFIDYRGKTPNKTTSGLRLITAKNVRMGFLNIEPEEFVASDTYDSWMTRGIPRKGDVLFTTEAPLANVAQLNTDEKVVFAQRIITMQPNNEILNSSFLKYSLMSGPIQKRIHEKGTGATATGIKASLLKKIAVEFPKSLKTQEDIVQTLDALRHNVDVLEQKYNHKLFLLDELKKSLLQKAFTGELTKSKGIAA